MRQIEFTCVVSDMVVHNQIVAELQQIAVSMREPAPCSTHEDLEHLIIRKRQEQGIDLCKGNDAAPRLGTLAGARSIAAPR